MKAQGLKYSLRQNWRVAWKCNQNKSGHEGERLGGLCTELVICVSDVFLWDAAVGGECYTELARCFSLKWQLSHAMARLGACLSQRVKRAPKDCWGFELQHYKKWVEAESGVCRVLLFFTKLKIGIQLIRGRESNYGNWGSGEWVDCFLVWAVNWK